MHIEIVRVAGRKQPLHIISIDGELHTPQSAADKLGLAVGTLQKRIERGTPLDKPLQRRVWE